MQALTSTRFDDPGVAYLAGLSPGSRPAMLSSLRLLRSGPVGAVQWHRLTRTETLAVRAWLVERYAPATANRHLSALRGVLRESWRAGRMPDEAYRRASDLPSVKATRLPAGRMLSPAEIEALFAAARAGRRPARDVAMLSLLLGVGLRRSEVATLAFDDLNLETGELTVRSGKGNRDRTAWMGAAVRGHVRAWVVGRPLWPTLFNLKAEAIYKRVRVLGRAAGILDVRPHDMRRTFVSALLDAGADLSAVKELAGHASIETTARYDRRGERAKQRAAELVELPAVESHENAEAVVVSQFGYGGQLSAPEVDWSNWKIKAWVNKMGGISPTAGDDPPASKHSQKYGRSWEDYGEALAEQGLFRGDESAASAWLQEMLKASDPSDVPPPECGGAEPTDTQLLRSCREASQRADAARRYAAAELERAERPGAIHPNI